MIYVISLLFSNRPMVARAEVTDFTSFPTSLTSLLRLWATVMLAFVASSWDLISRSFEACQAFPNFGDRPTFGDEVKLSV